MNITLKEKSILSTVSGLDKGIFLYPVVNNSFKPKGFVGVVNSLVKKGLVTKEGSTFNDFKVSLTDSGEAVLVNINL